MLTSRTISVADVKKAARRRLPRLAFDYIEGGALDERTVANNARALAEIRLRQRVFVDVSDIDTSTTLQGRRQEVPIFVSPMGLLGMFHPDADGAVARAAADAGAVFIHSGWSGVPIAEVARQAPGSVWAQLALAKDATHDERHLTAIKDAGIEVLVLPGDVAVHDRREREMHHGLERLPPVLSVADVLDCATKPKWVWDFLTGPRMQFGNFLEDGRPITMRRMRPWMRANENRAVTWETVDRLRERWPGKIVVKAVMDVEDALVAAEHGVDGIIVSNHGGRQFDSQPGTADVLPAIAAAVGERLEVYADSGVTRGGDVLKMIARGARGVGIGRAAAWGLAAAGERGVRRVFELLIEELRTAMAFTGVTSVAAIGPEVIATPDAWRAVPDRVPSHL